MIIRALFILSWILCVSLELLAQEKPFLGAEIRTIETFTYGKFEARMKTAQVSGIIHSFFTFYDEPDFMSKWNEIDVEILGRYTNEVQFNSITGNHTMHEKRVAVSFNPHEEFHLYSFTWTPSYLMWMIDGVEVHRETGYFVKTMNRSQKIMMNVWPSSSIAWAGEIDANKIPLQTEYDFVNYYSYEPAKTDSFQLKWTDNFDFFDANRWQLASHTFDTNECVFTPENAVVEGGYLKLRLTKPIDDEVVYTPLLFIESAATIPNTSKKYEGCVLIKIRFYQPINRVYYKPDFFTINRGEIKHHFFDIDRNYVLLYVSGLNTRQVTGTTISYKPTGEEGEMHAQEILVK